MTKVAYTQVLAGSMEQVAKRQDMVKQNGPQVQGRREQFQQQEGRAAAAAQRPIRQSVCGDAA